MLWIHYLVGVSHFAECCENRPVTVREMLINLQKSLFRNGEEMEKQAGIRIRDRISPDTNSSSPTTRQAQS